MNTPDYTALDLLYTGARATVYRARRISDGRPVLLRAARIDKRSAALAQLQREQELLSIIDGERFLSAPDPRQPDAPLLLVSEDPGGVPLKRLIGPEGMPLAQVLAIASSLIARIGELHRRRIVHRDINPEIVLVDQRSLRVILLSYELASRLPSETLTAVAPEVLDGAIPYIAPEQTGRMNRPVDYRADFYSFGVTLYEMLTGELPFQATEPLELIHAHLAKLPVPPSARRPGVPEALSAITMKLLAKDAEDRYQSSHGVRADLDECAAQLAASGEIGRVDVGAADAPDIVRIPHKLYGRSAEIAALLQAFERAAGGRIELLLVSGPSGVGKTSLVHEMHKPVVGRRGFFITGGFERFRQDTPYLAFTRAAQELIQQLLSDSAERVAEWRRRILEELGPGAGVIVDVIPELTLLLGAQPAPLATGPTEVENRFRAGLLGFIKLFATAEHPMVLFLDDLQWADSASLKLLWMLASVSAPLHLLVVCGYRSDEVGAGHPVHVALDEIEASGAAVTRIIVGELPPVHVTELISDALRCSPEEARPLAELLVEKTGGNPFAVAELLRSLYNDRLVRLDPAERAFRWDLDAIRSATTDDVARTLIGRIQQLPARTLDALRISACVGKLFELGDVAAASGGSLRQAATDLWPAVRGGYVVPLIDSRSDRARALLEETGRTLEDRSSRSGTNLTSSDDAVVVGTRADDLADAGVKLSYRFTHDRIHHAVYSLLPEDERPAVHLRLGRHLLLSAGDALLEERLFDIVSQLNAAAALIVDPDERLRLARLNLLAGRKAKAATAYALALQHLDASAELLPDDVWTSAHDLAFDLHLQQAEGEYLLGRFEEAERLFNVVLAEARAARERAVVCTLKSKLYRHKNRFADALGVVLDGLRILGVEVPLPDDLPRINAAVGAAFGELAGAMQGRSIEELVDLPEMRDPHQLAAMDLLDELSTVGMYLNPMLTQLATLERVLRSLRHGNARSSAPAYAAHGMALGPITGDFAAGHAFGGLALALSRKQGDASAECRALMWYAPFISAFREHVSESISACKEAYELAVRCGEPTYAGFAAFFLPLHCLFRGDPLDAVLAEEQRRAAQLDPDQRQILTAYRQLVMTLKGRTSRGGDLDHGGLVEEEYVRETRASYSALALQHYYCAKLQALVYFGRHEEALAIVQASAETGDVDSLLFAQLAPTSFALHHAIAAAARYADAPAEERAALLSALHRRLEHLRVRAENCPDNFLHLHRLVAAEVARVEGRDLEAIGLYDEAGEAARRNGFVHHQALAVELAARHHLAAGRLGLASACLEEARDRYRAWGATGKVASLEEAHRDLLPGAQDEPWAAGLSTAMDLTAVLKAAQAMSGEIVLERLLQRIMRMILANAGAQSGHLILERDGVLRIEASGAAGGEEISALRGAPVAGSADLPVTLVNYVERSGQRVVLDDAARSSSFFADPYVVERRPRSVLCAPIFAQQKRVGILYLENNLVTGAFTPDRLGVLDVLCAQAAISLENARLYETLEQKVRARTRELSAKNAELEAAMRRVHEARQQLVVQEKLASLGALTAGIAHEIRNPLNFVNNFAEAAIDLAAEIKDRIGMDAPRLDPELLADLEDSLGALHESVTKIHEHGRRANAIVGTMLLHAHGSTGERERADLNVLLGESVNLVARGTRGRYPALNVRINTQLEEPAAPVEVVVPDIRRVFINILNNAYDAMSQKQALAGPSYTPELTVRTRDHGAMFEIRIRDNGVGIADDILRRIFDPFFTTKPANLGTGLGLSISHDIVVQGHQGSIRVETEPGEYAEFVITLPRHSLPGAPTLLER